MGQKPMVVGICGGSASGKTTFTEILAEKLSEFEPVVLNQDRYFRDWSGMPEIEREAARTSNHPRAVLWEHLVAHVADLREGKTIEMPPPGTWSFGRGGEIQHIVPQSLAIVEGHLIFGSKELRPLMDLKIFLDVDPHERVLRRMLRDTSNRTLEEAVAWYRRDVIPNFPVHTEATRQYADLIIPFEGEVETGVEVVVNGIRAMIDQ